jgi:DNA-binding transcriptional LysR family regulator
MRLPQLRALAAIADMGSVRAAARKLRQSQPALTKSLRQLEEEFQLPLFRRTSSGMVLTEFGSAVLVRARAILTEMSRIEQEVDQLQGKYQGAVSVGVSPLAARAIMTNVLMAFRKQRPGIDVRIVDALFPGALPSLREGMLDMLVGPEPPAAAAREFHIERLVTTELMVAARRGHPRSKARTLKDLFDCEWMLYGPIEGPGSIYPPAISNLGIVPPRAAIVNESMLSAVTILESSDALCVLPRLLIQNLQRHYKIEEIRLRERLPSLNIGIMWRAGIPLTPAANILASLIIRRAASIDR